MAMSVSDAAAAARRMEIGRNRMAMTRRRRMDGCDCSEQKLRRPLAARTRTAHKKVKAARITPAKHGGDYTPPQLPLGEGASFANNVVFPVPHSRIALRDEATHSERGTWQDLAVSEQLACPRKVT